MCISTVTIPIEMSCINTSKSERTMIRAFQRHIWIALVFPLLVLPIAKSYSQWSNVGRFSHEMHCAFFFNEMVGFIGGDEETRNMNGTSKFTPIYKTTDGGKTWIETNCELIPRINANIPPVVTDIFFRDSMNGWASIEAGIRRLLRTTDGGLNWRVINVPGQGTSVYQTQSALIVTTRDASSSGVVSLNLGNSFTNSFADSTNCVDFVDELHGVATGYEGSPSMRTIDGGQTWQWISPTFSEESWGVYAVKGTSTFYIIPEGDPSGPAPRVGGSPVYRSNDYGATWQQIGTSPVRGTGHPEGFGGQILYMQTEQPWIPNGSNNGLYRSDNAGSTWKAVGGPSHNRDRRFAVTGCRGGIVYAFDKNGNVFKTRTGGDGSIIEPDPEPLFSGLPIQFASRICDSQNASIKIRNEYCADLVIQDVQFVNTTGPLITSGALSITNSGNLPMIVAESITDSVTFNWDPSKLFERDTMVSVQVKITYFNRALGVVYDTIITINARAIGDMPTATLMPPVLGFGNVSFCQPHDSLFTFTNTGCDTMMILSGNGSSPVLYTVSDGSGSTVNYPLVLPPGASFTYKVSLYLNKAGLYSSTMTFRLLHQGKQRDTTITLSASVSSDSSFTVPIILDIGKVSVCASRDSLIELKNLGCDSLRIMSASLTFGTDFTILPSVLPESVAPDSTSSLRIRLQPSTLGPLSDTLTLHFLTLDDPRTIKVVLRGEGVSGEASFIMIPSVDTLFTLAMTRCDAPQVFPISISNPGCYQLNIKEITITGAPQENVSRTLSAPLPTNVSNGQSILAEVTVTPAILGQYSGTIRIRYQIQGDVERDTILIFTQSVGYGTRVLELTPVSIDLGTFNVCTVIDTSVIVRNSGCDTLEVLTSTLSTSIGSLSFLYTPRILVPPGDTTSVRVRFAPVGGGDLAANITLTSTSDSTNPIATSIRAKIIPTDTVQIRLTPVRTPFYVGDTITMQLIPDIDVPPSTGLRNINFGMNFNGDLLTIISPQALIPGLAILPGASRRTLPSKLETQDYLMQGSPFIVLEKDKPFAEFRFAVSLTDTTTTSLFMSNIMLNNNDTSFAKCTLGVITAYTATELSLLCGDSTLREFMRSGNVIGLRIAPAFPNPVTSRTGFRATLPFTSALEQDVRIVIINALGNVVQTAISKATKGENRISLDARALPSGTYHFLISPLNSSSEAVVGKFAVER
jgi:photosystem II stability/assembly factor-like uncharacterized protein